MRRFHIKTILNPKQLLTAGLLFLVLLACEESAFPQDNMPPAYVDLELDLKSIQFNDLDGPKRYVYYPNEGLKGLIIYHDPDGTYKAFDRACPYHPNESCQVQVDPSNFFMKDECCQSTFDWEGQPTGGPAMQPLRKYFTSETDGYLIISSSPIFEDDY